MLEIKVIHAIVLTITVKITWWELKKTAVFKFEITVRWVAGCFKEN